jgi:hypothetical protein
MKFLPNEPNELPVQVSHFGRTNPTSFPCATRHFGQTNPEALLSRSESPGRGHLLQNEVNPNQTTFSAMPVIFCITNPTKPNELPVRRGPFWQNEPKDANKYNDLNP